MPLIRHHGQPLTGQIHLSLPMTMMQVLLLPPSVDGGIEAQNSKLPAVMQLEKRQADLDANPSQSLWSAVCDLSSLGLGLPTCEVELSLLRRS